MTPSQRSSVENLSILLELATKAIDLICAAIALVLMLKHLR